MQKNILGNYLKNLRSQFDLSTKALSEQINLSVQFINFVEKGERSVSLKTLKKYADFFKIDFDFLMDLLEKQKKFGKEDKVDLQTKEQAEHPEQQIQKLNDLLFRVNPESLAKIVTSLMEQVNDHLIKMTPNYSLTDLRNQYQHILLFNQNVDDKPIVITGFLKLPEKNQLSFKLTRLNNLITLEMLRSNQSKIEYFEKLIGPHVFSYLSKISFPQTFEEQDGQIFCWFSPTTTIQEQYKYLLKQELIIDSVLLNSIQLAWYIQQNNEAKELKMETV